MNVFQWPSWMRNVTRCEFTMYTTIGVQTPQLQHQLIHSWRPSVLNGDRHELHSLLRPKTEHTCNYNLGRRRHDYELPRTLNINNFIIRMLYKNSYWHTLISYSLNNAYLSFIPLNEYCCCNSVISSAKEAVFNCYVCLSFRLSLCLSVSNFNVKNTDRIFVKILLEMYFWMRKNWLNFGSHPPSDTEPKIFLGFFNIVS